MQESGIAIGAVVAAYVASSSIGPHAGLGLFAAVRLRGRKAGWRGYFPGDWVADYTGRLVHEEPLPEDCEYVLAINDSNFIDARDLKECGLGLGRYVNEARKEDGRVANAYFAVNEETNTAQLRAMRAIKPGEEVLVHYWRKQQ